MINTLIADDSEVFRLSLRRLLASRFRYMRIEEAATMGEAVSRAHAMGADLVFVDVRLPDGNGLDLARFLAPTLPQSRVCVMTSFDLPEYRVAARDAGACHYLAKSNSTSAEVISVVQAALSHRAPVVILDDNGARLARFAKVLARHWPVLMPFAARDASAALEMAAACKPDIVVARSSLLGGAAVVSAIKERCAETRVVAVGDGRPNEIAAALAAGADHAFAWKTHIVASLAPVVQSVLSRRPGAGACPCRQES
jgi:DNA-binding NarL/FixJ family response regulator